MSVTDASVAREILGLPGTFDADRLAGAFRRAAMRTHPDRGGNAEDFTAVVEAHELLRDALTPDAPRRPPSRGGAVDPTASTYTCHREVLGHGPDDFAIEVPAPFVAYSNVLVDCGQFNGEHLVVTVRRGTDLPWAFEPTPGTWITVRDGYDGLVVPGTITLRRARQLG